MSLVYALLGWAILILVFLSLGWVIQSIYNYWTWPRDE